MRKCPFWSSDENFTECFSECVMNKDVENGDECVFISYLDLDDGFGKLRIEDVLKEVVLDIAE